MEHWFDVVAVASGLLLWRPIRDAGLQHLWRLGSEGFRIDESCGDAIPADPDDSSVWESLEFLDFG